MNRPLSNSAIQEDTQDSAETITYCSFSSLLKQNAQARLLKRGSKSLHALQSGQHLSVFKGRGMDFHESRMYQSGDDIRHLDWRVTARTGKPHTKVFSEERERPIILIVDMRKTMFFGTRGCYKSVLAARIASLLAWKSVQDGDKAGGIIIPTSDNTIIHQLGRSQAATSRFVNALAKATQAVNFSNHIPSLDEPLKQIKSIIETGTQLIIISDFRGLDTNAVKQLTALIKQSKSSLTLFSISDPFEESLADNKKMHNSGKLYLSDGQRKIVLNKQAQSNYKRLQEARKHQLEELAHQNNSQLVTFSTADTSPEIITKLSRGLR